MMKNSITSSFLSMSRMKTMRNNLASGNSTTLDVVGLLDPMCHFVLFALLLEYEVLICLELVKGWQELVLMIYNQVVDTVVLLVCWYHCTSWRCCYIALVVGKVQCSWCQSRRCNRGTWHTSPSIRPLPETLGKHFVFLPSVQYGGVSAAFLYSSFCIQGFVMIFLPRSVTTFNSSWNDISGTVLRSF